LIDLVFQRRGEREKKFVETDIKEFRWIFPTTQSPFGKAPLVGEKESREGDG
jgi:hypothetical protein